MKHWSPADATEIDDLRLLADHCVDVIARVGPDFRFAYTSPSIERMFLRTAESVKGRHIAEFVLPEDMPEILEASRRMLEQGAKEANATVRALRGDGSTIWVELSSRLIGNGIDGQPGDRAVILRDVTERKALEDELRSMAMKDGLTGLANRRAFDEALAANWSRTVRDRTKMSLLMVDIDHFKAFNDDYGHQTGDDALRAVSKALSTSTLRNSDIVARYGGEEIALILPNTDGECASIVAERVRSTVEALAIPQSTRIGGHVTVSIGAATAVARTGGSAEMPHSLLAAADRALYQAKADGRNRCSRALLIAN